MGSTAGASRHPRLETEPSPVVESIKFENEDDHRNEIFPIPITARARTSVILAGKRDTQRASFYYKLSDNVVMAKISYQMSEIL